MKKITFLLTILFIFSVLTSCAGHSTPEAAIDSDSKVIVTTYSPDSFRQKTADAASWAENNAPEGKTEEKETYACDVIINNGAAYLLSLAYSSNGLKDTYTNRIEKYDSARFLCRALSVYRSDQTFAFLIAFATIVNLPFFMAWKMR